MRFGNEGRGNFDSDDAFTSLEWRKVLRSEWISRKVSGEISSLVFFRRRVRRGVFQTPYRLRMMSQASMMQP